MKLTTYTQVSLFEDLKPHWNDLVARSMANTPFAMWEYAEAWWEAYHPGDLWVTTIHDDEDKLLAIAPWFLQERVVRTIGHYDVTDYMDLIIDREHTTEVYETLAQFLADSTSVYDSIGLADIPEESTTYTEFPDILRAHGFDVRFEQNDVCPVIRLPGSFDDYLSMTDKSQRKDIKRKLRIATGGEFDIDWYIVGDEHDLTEEGEAFKALMAASEAEKAEFLQNEQHVAFFDALLPRAYEAGWLQLAFLTVDGTRAAAYLNFDYDNRILVYNSGLDPEKFGKLSPGIILLAWNIEHAIDNKRAEFNFLRGDEEYKYRMGGEDTRVFQLNAVRA